MYVSRHIAFSMGARKQQNDLGRNITRTAIDKNERANLSFGKRKKQNRKRKNQGGYFWMTRIAAQWRPKMGKTSWKRRMEWPAVKT